MDEFTTWRAELHRYWGESQAVVVCEEIARTLSARSASQLNVVTFQDITKAAKCQLEGELFWSVVAILTRGRFAILTPSFFYLTSSGEEIELRSEDLKQARLDGSFVDPKSGEAISDFESRVSPFFSANSRLVQMASGSSR